MGRILPEEYTQDWKEKQIMKIKQGSPLGLFLVGRILPEEYSQDQEEKLTLKGRPKWKNVRKQTPPKISKTIIVALKEFF